MDKGKAPTFPSSPSSPRTDIGTSASRDRSRSPQPSRRSSTTTSITVTVPSPQHEWPCDLFPCVFTTDHSLRGHLNIHSRPHTDNTAEEASDAIPEAHQSNPPPALAELMRPQLEYDLTKEVGVATIPGRRGTTVITGVPIVNPNREIPALPAPIVLAAAGEVGPSGVRMNDKEAGTPAAVATPSRVIDLNVFPQTSSEEEGDK